MEKLDRYVSLSKLTIFVFFAALSVVLYAQSGLCDEEFTHYHSPVEFRHYLHTEGQGIACVVCHTQLKGGSYIMLGHNVCVSCHAEQIDVYEMNDYTCGVCHPSIKVEGNQATVKLQMGNKPRGSFVHTQFLENICYVCHGAMLEEIVDRGKIRTNAEMRRIREISHRFYFAQDCGKCHEDKSKAQAPPNHESDWEKQHRQEAPTFNCRICHQKSYCQSCHDDVY